MVYLFNFLPTLLQHLPKKKPRGGRITVENKHLNQQLAKLRVVIEHINGRLKIFKILSERSRNRHQRFSLRFKLISGLYNYELKLLDYFKLEV
ncbi:transposase family protein [Synechocystis sp. PCC 7509]|uniref:transposase family protein n=1 Tax=Synechocystis sp. PCC 7509 TaxID=927677 RepID=UPI00090759BC